MTRARNTKPGFFTNEALAECGPEVQILFLGLIALADREGRLEDRPRRIKALIFPYYDVDVAAGIDALEAREFLRRYQVESGHYLHITNFVKHQTPHWKEAGSILPAPPWKVAPNMDEGSGKQAPNKSQAKTNVDPSIGEPSAKVGRSLSEGLPEDGESMAEPSANEASNIRPESLNPENGIRNPESLFTGPAAGEGEDPSEQLTKALAAAKKDGTKTVSQRASKNKAFPTEFETWWALYPRKEPSKVQAYGAWLKALIDGATAAELQEGCEIHAAAMENQPDQSLLPHATTWLSGQRWENHRPVYGRAGNGDRVPAPYRYEAPAPEDLEATREANARIEAERQRRRQAEADADAAEAARPLRERLDNMTRDRRVRTIAELAAAREQLRPPWVTIDAYLDTFTKSELEEYARQHEAEVIAADEAGRQPAEEQVVA